MSQVSGSPNPPNGPGFDRPAVSRAALLSLVLGVLSLGLVIVAGLPALVASYRGLYAINASEGRLRGRGLALAGMGLGLAGSALTLVWIVVLIFPRLFAASERVECADNLRRLGLGVRLYYDSHDKVYPPGTVSNPALKPEQRLSWMAALAPYLEQKDVRRPNQTTFAQAIDYTVSWESPENRAVLHTKVPLFLCPAHPERDALPEDGLTTYVGFTGIGPDSPTVTKKSPLAGPFGYDRTISDADVTAGLSYTTLVTETTHDNGPWLAGGRPTLRWLDPDTNRYIGSGAPFGGCHEGGLNVLWMDGSVRFQSDAIQPELFRSQVLIGRTREARAE
jgi:prepilin-type processing-associated H-X9-DG protein